MGDRDLDSCIWIDPGRQSGVACFGGTRVPVDPFMAIVEEAGAKAAQAFWPSVSPTRMSLPVSPGASGTAGMGEYNAGSLPAAAVYVLLGEPTTGLWCVRCSLPARIEVPIHSLSERGVSSGSTITRCMTPECQP